MLIALRWGKPLWIDLGDAQPAVTSANADDPEGSLLHKGIAHHRRRRFVTSARCNLARGGSV
jgi:hypothetical protein